jgi:hypothetical protein
MQLMATIDDPTVSQRSFAHLDRLPRQTPGEAPQGRWAFTDDGHIGSSKPPS